MNNKGQGALEYLIIIIAIFIISAIVFVAYTYGNINEGYYLSHDNIKCEKAFSTYCGMTLSDCENNNIYYCEKDVQKISKNKVVN